MNSQNSLETIGSLRHHTAAEVFAEILRAKLNGSLRLANNRTAQKTVVYFDAGDACFAVSNARRFRLFETLLSANKITKERLAAIPDFTNDAALRENLLKNGALPKAEIDALTSKQIELILTDAFDWRFERAEDGEWTFSPLVRIKGDIRFRMNAPALLAEYARNLPDAVVVARFKNTRETFSTASAQTSAAAPINLTPTEAFVFSRFDGAPLDVERAAMFSGLPAPDALRVVYTLWLAGFLERADWHAPFSERALQAIRSAHLTLKKPDAVVVPPIVAPAHRAPEAENSSPAKEETAAAPQTDLTLPEYLERVEAAPDYYRIFGVAADAPAADIKRAYLALAKRFHPDLFQRSVEAGEFKRIQDAFTRAAQGYETLKNQKSREVYDYRMRKDLEQGKSRLAPNGDEERTLQIRAERASEDFETGFSFFMDGNFADAVQLLARAAHFVPDNARYRAYYGKALAAAADARQKHKAEAEMQAAIRIEPLNVDYRLMLAEFFVAMNLPRRAEGELNRLLSIAPHNQDAKTLLDSLTKKG